MEHKDMVLDKKKKKRSQNNYEEQGVQQGRLLHWTDANYTDRNKSLLMTDEKLPHNRDKEQTNDTKMYHKE